MLQTPYKETQAMHLLQLLEQKRFLYFLSFFSWHESYILPLRLALKGKTYMLNFCYKDLSRFEPLVALENFDEIVPASLACFHFKTEVRDFSDDFVQLDSFIGKSSLFMYFLKKDFWFLTKMEYDKLKLFNEHFISIFFLSAQQFCSLLNNIFKNFYQLFMSQRIFDMLTLYLKLQQSYANFSSIVFER